MTSPAHPSSMMFAHSTPALAHRIASLDASSSSPPTDVIATPSDRHAAPSRTRNGKQQPRRSVRIRTSSGGHLDSSPQVSLNASASYFGELEAAHVHEIPTRTRAVRTMSGAADGLDFSALRSGTRQAQARSAQPPRLLKPRTTPEDALALAQAHGITPDQFEQAKQQVMRFLRTEQQSQTVPAPGPLSLNTAVSYIAPQTVATPTYPSAGIPHAPGSAGQPILHQHSLSRTPVASSALQAAFEFDASLMGSRSRPHPHAEDSAGRSIKRQRRHPGPASGAPSSAAELAVRQWAQEESSSSSSEDEAPSLASMLVSRRAGANPGGHAGSPTLAPSPAVGGSAGNNARLAMGPTDSNASPSLAGQRGMMDRFMSSQPLPAAGTASASASASASAVTPAAGPQNGTSEIVAPQHQSTSKARQPQTSPAFAPASPSRKSSNYPQHALLSPAPSRPKTSILFSPDVARLLRSELDELEANELSARNSSLSPRKEIDRSSDIVVDSSPFRGGASPFSSGGASRSRDIFSASQETSVNKRARWNNFANALNDNRATSPTPSCTSLSMRAPSFCDSSPAASERGSATSRQHSYLNPAHAGRQAHPASAPDLAYGGMPSSSPTSSQHSEYVPTRYSRSSPGPGPSAALAESDSSPPVEEDGSADMGARKKRTPVRHNDSVPSFFGVPSQAGGDPYTKPRYSYAALIGQALFSTPDHKMALADIYTWIMSVYPYFKKDEAGWQNSIRHNLSLNQCFIKTARGPDNPGKGCLWAIKPGTEEQFADGDFVRKGGQGNTRRKGTGAGVRAAQTMEKPEPQNLLRGGEIAAAISAVGAGSASDASSRSESPVPTVRSRAASGSARKAAQHAYSPAPSMVSIRSATPVSASPMMAPTMQLAPPVQLDFSSALPPLVQRPASAGAVPRFEIAQQLQPSQLAPPAPTPLARSQSSMGFLEPAAVAACASTQASVRSGGPEPALEPIEEEAKPHLAPPVALGRTFSAPMLATQSAPGAANVPPPASPPPSHLNVQRLHEPLLTAMSPPTSVYHRLAGPYQPLSYGSTLAQNHRALALLASPEASGIMTSRGSSPRMLVAPSSSTPFLPPGNGRKRQRTESDNRMLSPTALVHTQSPISSIRGGPRQPMSPVQDKLAPQPDPAKKLDMRAPGTRLLPSVNALASSDFDPFRSPPPSSSSSAAHALATASARYHLRSPSARFQAALSTPGGPKSRNAQHQLQQTLPLGFSPSLATGSSWERTTAEPSGATTPWSEYWPSPGAGSGAAQLPW